MIYFNIIISSTPSLPSGLLPSSFPTNTFLVGFEVFTVVVLKSIFFWDMTQRTTRRRIPEDDTLQVRSTKQQVPVAAQDPCAMEAVLS
jgi:hypothetical protein